MVSTIDISAFSLILMIYFFGFHFFIFSGKFAVKDLYSRGHGPCVDVLNYAYTED